MVHKYYWPKIFSYDETIGKLRQSEWSLSQWKMFTPIEFKPGAVDILNKNYIRFLKRPSFHRLLIITYKIS